jgi:hypothetical protein
MYSTVGRGWSTSWLECTIGKGVIWLDEAIVVVGVREPCCFQEKKEEMITKKNI